MPDLLLTTAAAGATMVGATALARLVPGCCGAWRNRVASAGLTLGFLLGSHALLAEPLERARLQYLVVVTLGYGHLIGALVFSRSRLAALRPPAVPTGLAIAFVATSLLALLALYGRLLEQHPVILLPLLAISAWHTVENDLLLGQAYGNGLRTTHRLHKGAHHVLGIGVTAVVCLLAAGTEEWKGVTALFPESPLRSLVAGLGGLARFRAPSAAALSLPDLFTLVTGHHLLSWLIFFADRARQDRVRGRTADARKLERTLLVVHAPPVLGCAALVLWPSPSEEALRQVVFGPGLYLFWSALHVVQTAAVRRLDRCAPGVRPVRSQRVLPHPLAGG